MYARAAFGSDAGVLKVKKGKVTIPNSPFRCPHCTFELTPPRKLRCGVCDAIRPDVDSDMEIEEEEEEEAFDVKPAPDARAKLMLINGETPAEQVPFIKEALADEGIFDTVKVFDLKGDLNHVKNVRDDVVRRLDKGLHCIVIDRLVSKERQDAWIIISKRHNACCDVVLPSPTLLKSSGFLNVFTLPLTMKAVVTAFNYKGRVQTAQPPGVTTQSTAKPVAAKPVTTPASARSQPSTRSSSSYSSSSSSSSSREVNSATSSLIERIQKVKSSVVPEVKRVQVSSSPSTNVIDLT